ncbi:MAG: DUF1254 domain-containing protein [Chromatiaceae bacterium]|nr:DUF1254 domain-containing protein [Chromatiaceae bacterium]
MKLSGPIQTLLLVATLILHSVVSIAAESVTVDNFVRAETDMTMDRYVKQDAFGKFLHIRVPTPLDKQDVIRMNRDTLYSMGVFDLDAGPVTITKPESTGRFQSMLVINQDHSMLPVEHGSGKFSFDKDVIGTRYMIVVFRTFADAADAEDVKAANALQDAIQLQQQKSGLFEIPDWDEASLKKVRDAINVLAATRTDTKPYFGDKSQLNPLYHLLGTAMGWGGNPPEAAMYDTVYPAHNDGETPHSLTVKDVPVDGFWSITVYNKEGFMEKNDQNAYSYNNVTAAKNGDGSITVNFGSGPDAINNLPISAGWNYAVRMYQPQRAIIDGSWTFPRAEPVR